MLSSGNIEIIILEGKNVSKNKKNKVNPIRKEGT